MSKTQENRVVALLTDFGLQDHFVGVMKGVIAGIAPRAKVVDISHEVTPYQVRQARFLLGQSWPWFPAGSVFLCVVDPGVGSARRPLLVEADKRLFVGPDNGLFSEVLQRGGVKAREITNRKLFAPQVSATFHGRDVFAPVAAHLAAGLPPAKAGPLIKDAMVDSAGGVIRTGRRFWTGSVAHVDRFGNLITNLPLADFSDLGRRPFALKVGLVEITELAANYASGRAGDPLLLVGSSGNLEVAVNQGSAARKLGVGPGAPVELELL
jgi:S-adenosylmethionine hydrolase